MNRKQWLVMKFPLLLFMIVLLLVLGGCHFTDSQVLSMLKERSLSVANTITGKAPESIDVDKKRCEYHKTTKTCYYRAEYSFPGMPEEELRSMASKAGWIPDRRYKGSDKYLENRKYIYCHSLLEINENKITVHCYKIL